MVPPFYCLASLEAKDAAKDEARTVSCARIVSPSVRYSDLLLDVAETLSPLHRQRQIQLAMKLQRNGLAPFGITGGHYYDHTTEAWDGFVCGSGIEPCDDCGQAADYLCDFPAHGGEDTCSRVICEQCKRTDSAGLDYCPAHWKLL